MWNETDLSPQSTFKDILRTIVAGIDKAIYGLLGISYQLFFSVASTDIFSTGVIVKFFQRVQVIIGIFVLFQLAMTVLKGIVDPDSFSDSKTGATNLFKRIATALVMLALVVPISIPSASNEYEKQINNNGLLFGTLYSLQYRILNNNTIGKVVMGVKDTSDDGSDLMSSSSNYKKSADIFVSTILKGFYRINLIPEEDRKTPAGKEDDQVNANRVCKDIDPKIIDEYKKSDANPGKILEAVNDTCSADASLTGKTLMETVGKKFYSFTIFPIVSAVAGVLFVAILLGFCVEVAIRAIKLAILRLLAPIPIISYMDPKGSKDNAFDAWVKAVTSTYLDLFIRIASVYFVIYMIQQMLAHGITTNSTGALKRFTILFIFIGLFYFAKEAPKFIKQILGVKEDSAGLFSGIGKLAGIGAAGAGVVSGAVSGAAAYGGKGAKGVAKGVGAGLAGGFFGGINAGKALWKQEKPNASAIMAANRARAAKTYSNAADESTLFGRFVAGAQDNLGLKNQYQKMEDKIKYYGAATDAMKRIVNAFDGNGDYKYAYRGKEDILDARGHVVLKKDKEYSLKDYKDIYSRVQSSGDNTLIAAVDKAMKDAQGARLTELRTIEGGRAEIERRVNSTDKEYENWTNNDLVAYDAAKRIYDVASKYQDEAIFARFKDDTGHMMAFDDARLDTEGKAILDWGRVFKHEAGQAGKAADQIKNSDAYFQAKANATRAEEANKKK